MDLRFLTDQPKIQVNRVRKKKKVKTKNDSKLQSNKQTNEQNKQV